jgi:hypothetical protein
MMTVRSVEREQLLDVRVSTIPIEVAYPDAKIVLREGGVESGREGLGAK